MCKLCLRNRQTNPKEPKGAFRYKGSCPLHGDSTSVPVVGRGDPQDIALAETFSNLSVGLKLRLLFLIIVDL